MTQIINFIFRKMIMITLILFSFQQNIRSEICREVDLSDQVGPTRDQEQDGVCWAVSATYMVQQFLCGKKHPGCDRPLSTTDMMTCASNTKVNPNLNLFRFGKGVTQGGRPEWAINCAFGKKDGVCSEDQAPLRAYYEIFENPKQKERYDQCISNIRDPYTCQEGPESNSADIITQFKLHQDNQACTEKIDQFPPESRCAYEQMIGKECKENRINISDLATKYNVAPKTLSLKDEDSSKKFDILKKILNKNRVASIAVCLDNIKNVPELSRAIGSPTGKPPQKNGKCQRGHALTVVGIGCNPPKLKIRNSWGAGAPLEGDIPLDSLADAMMDVTYIGEKDKNLDKLVSLDNSRKSKIDPKIFTVPSQTEQNEQINRLYCPSNKICLAREKMAQTFTYKVNPWHPILTDEGPFRPDSPNPAALICLGMDGELLRRPENKVLPNFNYCRFSDGSEVSLWKLALSVEVKPL